MASPPPHPGPTATVARHKGLPRITQDNALQFADMEIPSLKGLKKGSKSARMRGAPMGVLSGKRKVVDMGGLVPCLAVLSE